MLPDRAGKTNKMGNVAIIGQVLGPAWTLFWFCGVCHGLVCPTIGGIDTLFAGQGQTASCSGTNALKVPNDILVCLVMIKMLLSIKATRSRESLLNKES